MKVLKVTSLAFVLICMLSLTACKSDSEVTSTTTEVNTYSEDIENTVVFNLYDFMRDVQWDEDAKSASEKLEQLLSDEMQDDNMILGLILKDIKPGYYLNSKNDVDDFFKNNDNTVGQKAYDDYYLAKGKLHSISYSFVENDDSILLAIANSIGEWDAEIKLFSDKSDAKVWYLEDDIVIVEVNQSLIFINNDKSIERFYLREDDHIVGIPGVD